MLNYPAHGTIGISTMSTNIFRLVGDVSLIVNIRTTENASTWLPFGSHAKATTHCRVVLSEPAQLLDKSDCLFTE